MLSAILITIALAGQVETADSAEAELAKAQQKKWNEYYAKTAADYEITRGKDHQQKLELKPEAVLHWSNPVRGGETNGSVFVWTYEGRAELVGTVFSHLVRGDPNLKVIAHSFQSLSHEPLAGQRTGMAQLGWSLAGAGVQPRPIPGAPPPAATAAGRLSQMRELAREFSATTMLDGVEQELRLLTQPIHRQTKSGDKPTHNVLDSALFTFVTGTDPELMLVIEVRTAEGSKEGAAPVWHFAAGRFTDLTLKLQHKKVELWTHERGRPLEGRPDPYISARYEMLPRILP